MHPLLYDYPEAGAAVAGAIRAATVHVARARIFDAVTVAELRPMAPPAVLAVDPVRRELLPGQFSATASHNEGSLEYAFDGVRESRWATGDRQRGGEWIELRFAVETDVARVRLEMDRHSYGDYPRGLIVETSADGEAWQTVFEGGVLPRLALSIVNEPWTPGIDVRVPPNATRVMRLRSVGETRVWFWSVHEQRLWAR